MAEATPDPPALRALPEGMRDALRAAYAVPARAYHHVGHALDVLALVDLVAAEGPGWTQPREVALAALYHDAVYDPARRDNEARSAELARAEIARWLPGDGIDLDAVARLINLTARHGALGPDDVADDDARNFLDCDMAILGAPAPVFDAYDQGIAAEYRGHVPGWLFRINRRKFLKALLARPRIYLGDFFHDRLDAAARANLRRVLNTRR